MRIACIIPTYNGCRDFERLLGSLSVQVAEFDLYVVDSSSTDGTKELALNKVSNVTSIQGNKFNHGGTRQMMVEQFPGYDVYVFLTQDACLENSQSISLLVAPFEDARVGAVCGRQLPHLDANIFAQHARLFNYPGRSKVKTFGDAEALGIKTPFMSNSFAAYRSEALLAVGGFPSHVILSEDMYVAAKMLLAGWKVAYSSDALCRHSHNYSALEEFRRYFDQGVFHSRESWIRKEFGGAGGEGLRYVFSELRFLGGKYIYLWPAAIMRNALKFMAYNIGQRESFLPKALKRKLSMFKGYWDSPYAEKY